MRIEPLGIDGAWIIRPPQFLDERGVFLEWLRQEHIRGATGAEFPVAQANLSRSRTGTVRGVHFSVAEPGQGKYVTCASGAVRDVVVDVRVGSPTFGQWRDVVLDDDDHTCLLIEPGLGHAFQALTDATVVYLCTTVYDPPTERAVCPVDPDLGIDWSGSPPLILSEKDRDAPTLADARRQGLLPTLRGDPAE
jgi:dTDP-4-dehydrorhamnose 3,5-epimerase